MSETAIPCQIIGNVPLSDCAQVSRLRVNSGTMVYYLHLLRHAGGVHSPTHDTSIPDPPLTAKGVEQCVSLSQDFAFNDGVALILTSPLQRTLQTAVIGFQRRVDGRYHYTKPGPQAGDSEPGLQAHLARLL